MPAKWAMVRWLFCGWLLGAVSVFAATPTDAAKSAKLRAAPITLYPDFELPGSKLPNFINAHGAAQDAVVVSYVDAFKTTFRIANLGVKRGGVWIYVKKDTPFVHEHWQNTRGATGIVFIPDRSPGLRQPAQRIADDARAAGCVFAVGIPPARAYRLADVADLCPAAQVFTLYNNDLLRLGADEYRKFVSRLAAEARIVNPKIKIEVGVATTHDEATTREMARILWECSDFIDRIAIYCEDSIQSYTSLALLYQLLRE